MASRVVKRTQDNGGEYDEAFTRSPGWGRTPVLYSFERRNRDSMFYEITQDEANQIADRIRRIVAAGE